MRFNHCHSAVPEIRRRFGKRSPRGLVGFSQKVIYVNTHQTRKFTVIRKPEYATSSLHWIQPDDRKRSEMVGYRRMGAHLVPYSGRIVKNADVCLKSRLRFTFNRPSHGHGAKYGDIANARSLGYI